MANFDLAIPIVLAHEGGYVNDPKDPGGETNFGISKRAYPALDIKNLTREQAIEIYRRDYWQYDGIDDQALATKVFDLGVLCYPRTANRMLQNAVSACDHILVADGVLGPISLAAVNAIDPRDLLSAVKQEAVEHFYRIVGQNQSLSKFLDGWLNRARS